MLEKEGCHPFVTPIPCYSIADQLVLFLLELIKRLKSGTPLLQQIVKSDRRLHGRRVHFKLDVLLRARLGPYSDQLQSLFDLPQKGTRNARGNIHDASGTYLMALALYFRQGRTP